ncbi:MAG: hypothetical protein VXY54_05360 [Pseudomonadota bacterium]|nr:hypothetical protein [Pseudomonadota bacterium]
MTTEPENLILEMLRRLDGKVDRLAEDVADLKTRMTAVEEGLAGVNRRLDRLEARVERIERRRDLAGAPA